MRGTHCFSGLQYDMLEKELSGSVLGFVFFLLLLFVCLFFVCLFVGWLVGWLLNAPATR